jgi:hypothetical protein
VAFTTPTIQSLTVARIPDILRSPLGFLFWRPQKEELVAEYIIREHAQGRSLDDILQDAYVKNRVDDEHIGRILERPEVVRALGSHVIESFESQG